MNSKLELRNMAVNSALNVEGVTVENVIAVAEKIYAFVIGDAELPEKYDPNEVMTKVAEMMNFNKPSNEKDAIQEADFTEEPAAVAEPV